MLSALTLTGRGRGSLKHTERKHSKRSQHCKEETVHGGRALLKTTAQLKNIKDRGKHVAQAQTDSLIAATAQSASIPR